MISRSRLQWRGRTTFQGERPPQGAAHLPARGNPGRHGSADREARGVRDRPAAQARAQGGGGGV